METDHGRTPEPSPYGATTFLSLKLCPSIARNKGRS